MQDFISHARALVAAQPGRLVFPADIHGRRVWIKRAPPRKTLVWHQIQTVIAFCARLPVLRPTVTTGGAEALRREAERLRLFRRNGISVPEILGEDEGLLVLSDAGPSLAGILAGAEEKSALLAEAARALAELHAKGLSHGRPHVRDMTRNGGETGFLDLEEDPAAVMPLPDAQARDIFLFLCAAAKHTAHLAPLAQILRARAAPGTEKTLHALARIIGGAGGLVGNGFLWKKIGNDARQAVMAARCLKA